MQLHPGLGLTDRPTLENQRGERLRRLLAAARAALAWENVWRAAAPVLTIVGCFVALSWAGLWQVVPAWARIAGLALFALAIAFALWREARFTWPSRGEGLARLDRDSGVPHRPASALDDTLATRAPDPATQALWALHRRRLEADVARLKLAPPSPQVPRRDRYALRAAALVAVIATAFVAGPERYARLAAAFDWRGAGTAAAPSARVDAWIDPPAYTGKPPVMLQTGHGAEAQTHAAGLAAPVGSSVVIRASDPAAIAIEAQGGLEPAQAAPDTKPTGAAARQQAGETRLTLKGDARLTMRQGGATLGAFDLTAIPDHPPTIELKEQPKPNVRGSLSLAYKIDDDYGVIGAEARFDNPIIRDKPVTGRHLVDPPRAGLALPSAPGNLGDATTTVDLSENPWAGARVSMTLHARDEGNNEGASDPIEILLPQRPFVKPLARALVEQRRNLVLAPDDRARVENSLEALLIAPDKFGTTAGVYLGLHSALYRLKRARTDPDMLAVADLLWEMALRIEDGDLSDAERDLRAAQQQLREALQRGASDEEIKKLTEQLRAALDKFLQELAERMQREQQGDQQQADRNSPRNNRTVTPQDLKSMLDRLEDMAKNGSLAEAQRMLDQLQNILENLQTAKRRQQQNSASREMSKALDELDKLTREQQELRDQTYRKGLRERQAGRDKRQDRREQGQRQRQRGQQQQGQQGQQQQDQSAQGDGDQDEQEADNGPSEQDLQQRQQALRDRLAELQKRMKGLGQSGESGLDDAEDAMKDAEQQLGKGQSGRGQAVESQGRALEALRRGAQQLAQRMQQQGEGDPMADADDDGGETPDGQPRQANRDNRADPLGRPMANDPYNPRSRYDPLGTPPAQRAQRVLEELRRRIGDPSRPQEELDYLDRLLRRF